MDNPAQQQLDFIARVEKDLLELISVSLKNRSITISQAQEVSREFLGNITNSPQTNVLDLLKQISEKYPFVRELYISYVQEKETANTKLKLDEISQHIQNGNLDQAVQVAKSE